MPPPGLVTDNEPFTEFFLGRRLREILFPKGAARGTLNDPLGKRGLAPFAGTARRVLSTNGACPLFPSPFSLRRHRVPKVLWQKG